MKPKGESNDIGIVHVLGIRLLARTLRLLAFVLSLATLALLCSLAFFPIFFGVTADLGFGPPAQWGLFGGSFVFSGLMFPTVALLLQLAARVAAIARTTPPILVLRSYRESWVARTPDKERGMRMGSPLSGGDRYPEAGTPLLRIITENLRQFGGAIMIGSERTLAAPSGQIVELSFPADGWLDPTRRLAHASRCVLLFPGTSRGLRTEVDMLRRENLLRKTVVVMPPSHLAPSLASDLEGGWENVRAVLAKEAGLHLPPYSAAGCFYIPEEDLSPGRAAPIRGRSARDYLRAITDLQPAQTGRERSFREVMRERTWTGPDPT
ncbi:MAG: hypothetical protein KDC98_11105 [Planctomycetes bacterium]|nr:hypothetical protein [Planctomycetota bacterium]